MLLDTVRLFGYCKLLNHRFESTVNLCFKFVQQLNSLF